MAKKRVLILVDNENALLIAAELGETHEDIKIFQSPNGTLPDIPQLNLQKHTNEILEKFDLVISLHCKQIFPKELVKQVRCINVHPGFNPYNRGWFPHVFSIINGLKAGVTIHEMDEKLDHGPIIIQKECKISSWDTSESVYERIIATEKDLLLKHFSEICKGTYSSTQMENEGNINFKKDYEKIKHLELDETGTFRDFLNQLRALTHGEYNNAYFIDENGKRIFIRVTLTPEVDKEENKSSYNEKQS